MIRATANRMLISMTIAAGDLAAATRHAQAGLDTLTESHLPSAMASAYYSVAMLRYLAGDLAGATAAADSGLATARRTSGARAIARLLLCRAFLLAEQGRGAEAADCIADAAQTHPLGTNGDTPVTAIWELSRMAVAHLMGRPQDAPNFTVVALNDDAIVMWQRPVYSTHTYLALGDFDAAATMVAKLREFGPVGRYVDALADRLDGLHSAATGSPDRALSLLSHAADEFAAMQMPVLASQARLEWAELSPDDPDIAEIVAGCLDIFQRSGAIPWVDRCRRAGRSLGVRITATRRAGELSNREAQVVRLVTDGLTNSQVAARLFLSERTVETHLRNVYARLGITSRVALARWAADNQAD
jgi:DNA-binding CsgD family transcriptional regulator